VESVQNKNSPVDYTVEVGKMVDLL